MTRLRAPMFRPLVAQDGECVLEFMGLFPRNASQRRHPLQQFPAHQLKTGGGYFKYNMSSAAA
jgi:hypothetical protein